MVTRYRTCSCPKPQHGGGECEGAQEYHGDSGVQLQRRECPVASFCPDCGGGQVSFPCGKPCPRTCEDHQPDAACLESPGCQLACACLDGQLLQDGACVAPSQCRCKYQMPWLDRNLSSWLGLPEWEYAQPGETIYAPCQNCTCVDGQLQCRADSWCRLDGGWSGWGRWSPCSQSCGEGVQYRFRECSNPPPQNGGRGCAGGGEQQRPCLNREVCAGVGLCKCLPGEELITFPNLPTSGQQGVQAQPALQRWSQLASPFKTHSPGGGQLASRTLPQTPTTEGGSTSTAAVYQVVLRPHPPFSSPSPEAETWDPWTGWSPCSVSCGGGEQLRSRHCRQPDCRGLSSQSKTCNTHVCLEVGCPVGRLYRECLAEEGCPYSCAHLTHQMDCFSDGCEEGCHCPAGTYQHKGACVQVGTSVYWVLWGSVEAGDAECPCVLSEEVLQRFRKHSDETADTPLLILTAQGRRVSPGEEVAPNSTISAACSNCSCRNGQLDCVFSLCPVDGGFAAWTPWSSCSLTCGGLGNMTRTRNCTHPKPAHGGKDCVGPRTLRTIETEGAVDTANDQNQTIKTEEDQNRRCCEQSKLKTMRMIKTEDAANYQNRRRCERSKPKTMRMIKTEDDATDQNRRHCERSKPNTMRTIKTKDTANDQNRRRCE
ncbi:hypothetical protein Chor_010811 [Crotalus horridus]